MCTPSLFLWEDRMQEEEAVGEGTAAGELLGSGGAAYLCSMFARHPWHSPFSLQEGTRETMRIGPDSGPKGSALKHGLRGCQQEGLLRKLGITVQIMSARDGCTPSSLSQISKFCKRPRNFSFQCRSPPSPRPHQDL